MRPLSAARAGAASAGVGGQDWHGGTIGWLADATAITGFDLEGRFVAARALLDVIADRRVELTAGRLAERVRG